jgi:hypothetical protein
MARVLSINGLTVPDDFPADQFEAVYKKLGSTYGQRSESIGALRDSANFPLATDPDERNVTWSKMLRAYGKAFPSDPILSELEKIWNDTEELRDIRNILTHRAVGARSFGVSVGPSTVPETTTIDRLNISLDATTTSSRRRGVAKLLLLGLDATSKFVEQP